MVERGANIDLVFRNGLKDYEVLPPADVWVGISPRLKRKKRSSVILMRMAASAALVISLTALSLVLVKKLPSGDQVLSQALVEDSEPVVMQLQPEPAAHREITGEVVTGPIASAGEISSESGSSEVLWYQLPEPGLFTPFVRNQDDADKKSRTNGNSGRSIPFSGSGQLINKEQAGEMSVKETPASLPGNSKWIIGAMLSPSYYSTVDFSANSGSSNFSNSEKAAVSYSGGLSFAYKLNSRISVQTGVYYSTIGQKVTGIDSYSGFNQFHSSKGSGLFSVPTSTGMITTTNGDIFLADKTEGARVITSYNNNVFDPVKAELNYINSSLHQNLNYLELPVILKYKVLDRTVDFNVSGGFSYNILVSNSAYSVTGTEKYYVGKTSGLSPVTLSSSIGMGVEYSLSRKLSLNLEPTFRYYLTPLGEIPGSAIHPYSFGLFSGLLYKF
jgi:hypothetical protein